MAPTDFFAVASHTPSRSTPADAPGQPGPGGIPRPATTHHGRLDTPVAPAAVAGLAGTAFVLLRLVVVAKGQLSRFVFAGRDFVNPAEAPSGLKVFPGSGYDGQFYYRLALDPADLSRTAFGITIDSDFRVQRIGYSVLSWLAAGGQRSLIVDSEVAVNLGALVVLAALGGLVAQEAGRHAGWGLLIAGYWGFLFSIGRDLPEVVASVFLIGGVVALRRHRPVVAGVAFAGAVLTLETTLDVVIALVLVCLVELVLHRRRPQARDAAWLIPLVAFVGWQLVGWAATGHLPIRTDASTNLGVPVVHMVGALTHYLRHVASEGAVIWLGEFAVLAVLTVLAAWWLRRSRIAAWEKTAWMIAVLVALSLSRGLWYGRADFRGFEDVYLLSSMVLLGSRHRLWLPAALVGVAWAVTFAHRVVSL